MPEKKDTNPKDSCGIRKVPIHNVPMHVISEVGLAMMEGHRKGYRSHNYRVAGVRASVYVDAVWRHVFEQWWEGQDVDPDSMLSHITKGIASLIVLRDSMMMGNWIDDRPPKHDTKWIHKLNEHASKLIDKYPEAPEPYTELNTVEPEMGYSKRVYLSHFIRGKSGKNATPEEMKTNCDAALEWAAELRKKFPMIDFYVPAEHEDFVSLAYSRNMLTEDQILAIDCSIIDRCDAVIFNNIDGYMSRGMLIERNHASSRRIPRFYRYRGTGDPWCGQVSVDSKLEDLTYGD